MQNNKNRRGIAMVIVLCTFALIISLGTAALVAANATYATAAQNVVQRQAYYTAVSYAQLLRREICSNTDDGICAQVKTIANGDEWTLSGGAAGDAMGTVSGTLVCNGATLNVTVTSEYQSTGSTVAMRFTRVAGVWVFDTFLPVPQGAE